jgi:Ala-tRNA(Pro) deacylase
MESGGIMTIASKLENYLRQREVKYKVVTHPPLAKGVLVKDDDGYLLVVLPADYHIELESLHKLLRQEVAMVDEATLEEVFSDCELGAVPPIGMAYGIKTIWDPKSSLGKQDKVFFEAGDHQSLVRMSGVQFHELMAPAERGEFSHHI